MSTVIHHGHPGSYKSAGVIQRVAIPELLKGRVVVTNIRGFNSVEQVEKAFGQEAADGAAIYYVDTEGKQGREHMARFFHWAPIGALIVIDEAQAIFPTARRDFKLENLDYPGGPEAAERDGRPHDVLTAFDMHRHYNWDIYLCTPHINKIHRDIREASQVAFRHWSMQELVPWKKGKWRELEHDPENNGKAKSHAYGVPKEYKIDPRTFRAYQSTKTGKHRQNQGAQPFYKDKKLIGVSIVALAGIGLLVKSGLDIYEREKARLTGEPVATVEVVQSVGDGRIDDRPGERVSPDTPSSSRVLDPLHDVNLSITGRIGRDYLLKAADSVGEFALTQRELASWGYVLIYVRPCHAKAVFEGVVVRDIYCARSYPVQPEPRQEMEMADLLTMTGGGA